MAGGAWGGQRRGRPRGEGTIEAIARLAGGSTTTGSKGLNGSAGVGREPRQRVEKLLRDHGYQRPFSTGPSVAIEVVLYGMETQMSALILTGVERVARKHDLATGYTYTQNPVPGARPWAEQVLARRPLGVIAVHSRFTPDQHAQLAVSGIPLVALDPLGEPSHPTPSVGATNWSGGVTAARHLVELGHTRIAVISGPTDWLCARARLEASRAA